MRVASVHLDTALDRKLPAIRDCEHQNWTENMLIVSSYRLKNSEFHARKKCMTAFLKSCYHELLCASWHINLCLLSRATKLILSRKAFIVFEMAAFNIPTSAEWRMYLSFQVSIKHNIHNNLRSIPLQERVCVFTHEDASIILPCLSSHSKVRCSALYSTL